jgi:hypothetical protein
MTGGLPHSWFDTPNIHLFSLNDFFDWCREKKVIAEQGFGLAGGQVKKLDCESNISAEEVLLFLTMNPGSA